MAQIYGAGGKTKPKRGRLGTGSYWPRGTPIFTAPGTAFPIDNQPDTTNNAKVLTPPPDYPARSFGEQSRAGIATIAGRNLTQTHGESPLTSLGNYSSISTSQLQQPRVVSSPRDASQPIHPAVKPLQMPHERNGNSAQHIHKKPHTYRTSMGAGRTMPVDTAFQHNDAATNKLIMRPLPKNAVEAVKKSAPVRSIARVPRPMPVFSGIKGPHRTPVASFVTQGNLWSDPNQSFIKGHPQVTTGDTGTGRWEQVKRSVV
jgi:hypothetical protein